MSTVSRNLRWRNIAVIVLVLLAVSSSFVWAISAGSVGLSTENTEHSLIGYGANQENGSTTTSTEFRFNFTVYRVDIHKDGNATWTVEQKREIQDEQDAVEFQKYISKYENGEINPFDEIRSIRDQLRKARTENIRPMSIKVLEKQVTVEDSLSGRFGVARIRFRWSNFGEWRNKKLYTGDVFVTGLDVNSNERLVIEYDPRELEVKKVVPEPNNNITETNTVEWKGENRFLEGRPKIVFVKPENSNTNGSGGGNTGGDGNTDQNSEADSKSENGIGIGVWIAVLSVVILGVVGFVVVSNRLKRKNGDTSETETEENRRLEKDSEKTADNQHPGGSSEGGPAQDTKEVTEEREEEDQRSEDKKESEVGYTDKEVKKPVATDEDIDEELMSNEDRVIHLLNQNGGRMKQKKIVEATDWSKSKVSLVLSDMEDEGQISKLKIGRENVVQLENGEEN